MLDDGPMSRDIMVGLVVSLSKVPTRLVWIQDSALTSLKGHVGDYAAFSEFCSSSSGVGRERVGWRWCDCYSMLR